MRRSLFRELPTPRPENTWRRSSSSAAVILKRRSHSCAPLGQLMELIGSEVYSEFETEARERLGQRDPEDWPMLATALAFGCPIWTEDTGFLTSSAASTATASGLLAASSTGADCRLSSTATTRRRLRNTASRFLIGLTFPAAAYTLR
jgi:hypothetical protein